MKGASISPRAAPKPRIAKNDALHDINQLVARRLKVLRRIRGRTQAEMGGAVGFTAQQMAKYECGYSKIAPGTLWKLACYLEVEIGYFFDGLHKDSPAADPLQAARQATRKRLQLDLIGALDNTVTGTEMLRSLRDFLWAAKKLDRDE